MVDFKGRAAIMRAAELGNVECFEKLAHAKANMKLRDVEGKGRSTCTANWSGRWLSGRARTSRHESVEILWVQISLQPSCWALMSKVCPNLSRN